MLFRSKKNGKVEELTGMGYWKEEHIHYHLLKHCIYGADIDSFAVQLTTINLLLKDLDNFTDELNIVECDSLIKCEEDYNWHDLKEQLKEEFEVVEYTQTNLLGEEEKIEVTQEKDIFTIEFSDLLGLKVTEKITREKANDILNLCDFWSKKFDFVIGNPPYILCQEGNVTDDKINYYRKKYNVAQYKTDLFHIFIERGLSKLAHLGKFSYITPNTYLTNVHNDKLREYLLDFNIEKISIIPEAVFKDVSADVCIINVCNCILNDEINIYQYTGEEFSYIHKVSQKNFDSNYKKMFIVNDSETENYKDVIRLGDVCNPYFGIQTMNKERYVSNTKIDNSWLPCITGKDIQRYDLNYDNLYLKYDDQTIKSGGNLKYHLTEKIVVRQIGNPEPVCTYEKGNYLSLNTIYNLVLFNNDFRIKYILAILNSEFIKDYWNKNFSDNKKIFPKIKKHQLSSIPIKKLDEGNQKKIETLVDEMICINEKLKTINSEVKLDENAEDIITSYKQVIQKKTLLIARYFDINRIINNIIESLYLYDKFDFIVFNSIELDDFKISYDDIIKENSDLKALCKQENASLFEIVNYLIENKLFDALYNYDELYFMINQLLIQKCSEALVQQNNHLTLVQLISILKEQVVNLNDLMGIFRYKMPTIQSKSVVKDAINDQAYTWNSYRKAKKNNKVNKTFIKYYDSKFYGLAEWSDEIHKNYFLDAIEEYTVNNPNEKKSKDILKLFKDLDIEDKQDYIEVIEEKIRKTFK